MSADIHARTARAERRWAKRGRAPATRLLSWMSRVHPWAWRVRLDLIVLFNLILAGLCFFLAHIAGPGIVVRTRHFDPSFAAGVLFAIGAVVALGCAVYWSFAVSRSARLREAAHYAGQPGLIISSLVFLSFAFWTMAGGISPFANLKRHPLFGGNIEVSIEDRIKVQRNVPPSRQEFNPRDIWIFRMAPQARPSETACRRAASSSDNASASLRDRYLCSLSARARKANLWRTLTFDPIVQEWRDDQAHVSTTFILANGSAVSFANPPDLAEAVVQFASKTEPWKSRIAAMKPWERDADILEDSTLATAFAWTVQFDRLIAREILFGRLGYIPEAEFESVPEHTPPNQPSRSERWQVKVRAELMTTRAYGDALAAAEDAFQGAGPAPPIFSAQRWDEVRRTRAHLLATFHMTGDVDTTVRLSVDAPQANWLAQGVALEHDPAARTAFLGSAAYAKWKDWYLHALVSEGAFAAEVPSLKPYGHVAAHWRATLLRPFAGPEAQLSGELMSEFELWPTPIFAALVLAFFLVSLHRTGLAATLGALAVQAILALLLFNAIWIVSYESIGLRLLIFRTLVVAVLLTPLLVLALFLTRSVQGRWIPFLSATSIWGVVIWSSFALPVPDLITIPVQNVFLWVLISAASSVLIVVAVVELVLAMHARIARFPRTS